MAYYVPVIALRMLATSLAAIVLAVAAYWAGRFTWADVLAQTRSLENARRAVRLVPSNASYHDLVGRLEEWEGGHGTNEFREAVRLNPRASSIWIHLAQTAEQEGNRAQAESDLLAAARVDNMFDPRWALANFYFRAGDEQNFWKWMALAMERMDGDGTALFDLCWRMPGGMRQTTAILPKTAESLSRYLPFVMGRGEWDTVSSIARQLASFRRPQDRKLLLDACDRLIAANRTGAAGLWQSLARARMIPYDAGNADLLTNGDFHRAPLDAGFDWHRRSCAGISPAWLPYVPPVMKFELSGAQPDECDLLDQTVFVREAGSYRLRVEQWVQPQDDPGFRWLACAAGKCRPINLHGQRSDNWTALEGTFDIAAPGLTRIVLQYACPSGVSRFTGELRVRRVGLDHV